MHLIEILPRLALALAEEDHFARVHLCNPENVQLLLDVIEDYRDTMQCIWGYSKQGLDGDSKVALETIRVMSAALLGVKDDQ